MKLESVLCRSFLACFRSFQFVSCSLLVVSSHFLLVAGGLRPVSCLFQVVSGRFRSFRVLASANV